MHCHCTSRGIVKGKHKGINKLFMHIYKVLEIVLKVIEGSVSDNAFQLLMWTRVRS